MEYREKPRFIVKKNLQKSVQTGKYFCDVVTPDVLADVCCRIADRGDFDYLYVDNDYEDDFLPATYNKGRLAIMHYRGVVHYISFSEKDISGRNSSVQSVPTAFNMYYLNLYPRKRLHYYFLNESGNAETYYQRFIYRLMETVGFEFLNAQEALTAPIHGFTSIDDIIFNRRINAGRNRSNNSTFINKCGADTIEIYGKMYGANKYETSLICYALSQLCDEGDEITLYEMVERDLKELPRASLDVIEQMDAMDIVRMDESLERNRILGQGANLRSPRYLFNLGDKLGNKHCALCDCEIPELIQGAHIWPVADIRRAGGLTEDQKFEAAIDGDNGLWLCENHHKMFDERIITFNETGEVLFRNNTYDMYRDFIDEATPVHELPEHILTDRFLEYLWRRNQAS